MVLMLKLHLIRVESGNVGLNPRGMNAKLVLSIECRGRGKYYIKNIFDNYFERSLVAGNLT